MDILARKSARRTKVRGQIGELNSLLAPVCRGAARADFRACRTPGLPREDPNAEVGEEVRVDVLVGPEEFKL